jgi:hypothetical protein
VVPVCPLRHNHRASAAARIMIVEPKSGDCNLNGVTPDK